MNAPHVSTRGSTSLPVLLLLACLAPPSLAQGQSVKFPRSSSVALWHLNPQRIVTSDLDSDGHEDLVVTVRDDEQDYQAEGNVVAFFGDGQGGFTPSDLLDESLGHRPVALALLDFDGNGVTDVVWGETTSCCFYPGQVHVLLGSGGRDFVETAVLQAGGKPSDFAGGDFDADGVQDLIVSTRDGAPRLMLFRGNGDGTFEAPSALPGAAALDSRRLVAADFDRNGRLDVAAAHLNGVSVWLSGGAGSFLPPASAASIPYAEVLRAADLDRDGQVDLAVVRRYPSSLLVLRGNGDGTFAQLGSLPLLGTYPNDLVLADLDRDRILDASLTDEGNAVSILRGAGNGSFLPERRYGPVAWSPSGIAIGDWNEDGALDLATPHRTLLYSDAIRLWFQAQKIRHR